MPTFLSGGKPIRLHVHLPEGSGPFPAILLLHGAGGSVDRWTDHLVPTLNRLRVALYAVSYFDRTGTLRADPATILDGYHVPLWLSTIADALTHISAQPSVNPRNIAVIGISLGGFLGLALGTQAKNIRAIIDISGGLSEPWAAAANATFPPTLIVHGDADTIVPVSHAHTLDALLTRLSVRHQTLILAGEGHWFSPAANLRILGAISSFLSSSFKLTG